MTVCIFDKKNKRCMNSAIIQAIAKSEKLNSNDDNLYEQLNEKLQCNNSELCILKNSNLSTTEKMKYELSSFKPYTQSLSFKHWLNNLECDQICYQMQLLFKGYYFTSIHMIDMVMIVSEIYKIIPVKLHSIKDMDLSEELINPKLYTYNGPLKSFSIIFNTDPSSKSGQHWFVIFINMDPDNGPMGIELFNSSGNNIHNNKFNEYWQELALKISYKLKIKFEYKKITSIVHQDNVESGSCGVYSLFYIYSRLMKIPSSAFNNKEKKFNDIDMTKFRKALFRDALM